MNWMLGSVMAMATCVLGASTTWACEPEPVLPMYPHWQQELPTDAVLQITVTDEDVLQDIVVVDADDQAVALDVDVVYDRYGQLTPQQPLTPGAYTLSVPARGTEWGEEAFDRPFTVVERQAPDVGAFTPTPSVFEESEEGSSCYPPGTLFSIPREGYALIVVDDSGDDGLVDFEDSVAPYTLAWPIFVEAGETQMLRFGAFDQKGVFTGWGELVEFTSTVGIDDSDVPIDDVIGASCVCTRRQTRGAVGFGLAALLGVMLRRRRR